MKSSMSKRLASLRGASGMTQEEVARHLGVTKAAVSKWECGQSLPDISLLPAVAELYSVTVDELFGLGEGPDQAQIDASYLRALEKFGESYEEGMEHVRLEMRAHWSCLPMVRAMATALFAQIPTLEGSDERPLAGRALDCAKEAERLYRRVVALAPAGDAPVVDLVPLSVILQRIGRGDEARGLLDDLVAKEPSLAAVSLARVLCEADSHEEAIFVLQRALLISLIEAQSALAALIPVVEDGQLEHVAYLASQLQPSASYATLSPMLMPSIRLEQARRRAAKGQGDAAVKMLLRFADDLDVACDVMTEPANPPLFDHVKEMMWEDVDDAGRVARSNAVAGLRTSYAKTLAADSSFDVIRSTDDFAELVERISGRAGKEQQDGF